MTKKLLVTDNDRSVELEQQRQCGDCCACCVLPRISELEKPGYRPCQYLAVVAGQDPKDTGGQCGCYSVRPEICRDYQCLWRAGMLDGDERRRPDRLGLMFSLDQIEGQLCMECWELWEGAAREYPSRGVLDAVAAQTPVLIRWYGVPCSLMYRGPYSIELGRELSRWAREDPRLMANWLEQKTAARELEMPDAAALVDLDTFRRGKGVPSWFGRDGRLALPVASAASG